MIKRWARGERVRVYALAGGVGELPAQGAKGVVEDTWPDGTVIVKLDDGKRGLFESFELRSDEDAN